MIDVFKGDGFSLIALTKSINRIPNTYGKINQLGLMPIKGVTGRTIMVENKAGTLNLLPMLPVGAPGTMGSTDKRTLRAFIIPHIPHDDVVLPHEVDNIRVFGSDNAVEGVSAKVAEKLANMRSKHALTLEYLRMACLKGEVVDGDLNVVYNWYTEFGMTQKEVDFVLGTTTTDVRGKCTEVVRHMEDNLKGENMNGVRALVSAEFYDKLVKHAEVKEAFKYYKQNQDLSSDMRTGFTFGGVTFEEYRGTATSAAGVARRFIAANYGHAYPIGTSQTFETIVAPADFNETVNTIGLELYAKQEERKFGRGWDIHTQSNPLPICYRPELCVQIKSSN